MIPKKSVRLTAAAGVAFLALAGAALVPMAAQAAPPTPAAPADPTLVFEETFENVTVAAPANTVGLANYEGVDGTTYTASDFWLNAAACNGIILQGTTSVPFVGDGAACNNAAATRLLDLATVLGDGDSSNHAVAAYTEANGPSTDTLLAESIDSGIELTEGHFYVASIDTAEVNCTIASTHSELDFGLTLATGEVLLGGEPAVACNSTNEDTVNGWLVRSGQFFSAGFQAPETTGAELLVRNRQTTGGGNDFAYDNLRFFDATPSIYKAFDQEEVEVGQPVTMYLTVVNTSELSEKTGWSFTDSLPSGMTVADEPNVSSTCAAGDIEATAGGDEVVVDAGSIADGVENCQITVDVVLGSGGDFTNVIEGATGLNGEPSATIRALVPSLSLTKSVSPEQVTEIGQEIEYSFVILNDGDVPLTDVEVSDPGPVGGTGTFGAIDCGEVTELAVDESITCTATYVAGEGDLTGEPLTNTASATGVSPGGTVVGDEASADLATRALVPSLSLTKTVNPDKVTAAGQKVEYTFVVLNDGEVPLTDIEVSDPGPIGGTGTFGDIVCEATTELAVGDSLNCAATYVAGAGDLTGKALVNEASATAVSPDGTRVGAEAAASVATVIPAPATGNLAATGGDIPWGYGVTAGVLLLVGAGIVLVSRKRTA